MTLRTGMTQFEQRDNLARAVEPGQASSWFVPPLVVPVFLVGLIIAYVIYQAYL